MVSAWTQSCPECDADLISPVNEEPTLQPPPADLFTKQLYTWRKAKTGDGWDAIYRGDAVARVSRHHSGIGWEGRSLSSGSLLTNLNPVTAQTRGKVVERMAARRDIPQEVCQEPSDRLITYYEPKLSAMAEAGDSAAEIADWLMTQAGDAYADLPITADMIHRFALRRRWARTPETG